MDDMSRKQTSSLRGYLTVGLFGLGSLTIVFLYFNWGIWRSKSRELLGVELPLTTVYSTDLSDRGREAGYFVVVYRLPEDTQTRLDEHAIDLSEYPMFSAGFERDNYKRVNWAKGFPRNEIEEHIFNYFKHDVHEAPLPTLEEISDDTQAAYVANDLLQLPETLCGGWYKYGTQDSSGHIWMPHFYFYLMNIEHQTLIMFALDT